MYKPPCSSFSDRNVILQISGLSYLRVKEFEDTIYGGLKIIKKAVNYRDSPQDFETFGHPTLYTSSPLQI